MLPPRPPPPLGPPRPRPSPRLGGVPTGPPPLLLLRCGDVEPHPGPMRVVQANVTSLRLHWHTVTEWHADMVLISETRLTAVARQVMCAKAGALGWQAFWGAPLESRAGGGGGACGMRRPVGWVSWFARAFPPGKSSPPKGRPETRRTPLPKPCGNPTRWCHVLMGLGRGADSLNAHGAAPQLVGGDLNFDLSYPLRAPPSVLASLLTRRLVDADLELASALGRDPLCSYQGPQGTRPSRIDAAAAPH